MSYNQNINIRDCFRPQQETGKRRVYQTQKAFLRSSKLLTGYFGGFGSGKTEALIAKAIIESITIPNNSGIIAAESYPVLRRGAMFKFFQQLERIGINKNSQRRLISVVMGLV